MTVAETIADLGEDRLLARLIPTFPAGPGSIVPVGDDAAVSATSDGRLCVTVDLLVEGVHFRRDWSSADDVGWRAIVQNLSDVAAMGAQPHSVVVGLAMPPTTAVPWIEALFEGLTSACRAYGAGLAGGDLTQAGQVVVSVTAHGDLHGRPPLRRSGAAVGDTVAHAGNLGLTAAGYALMEAGLAAETATETAAIASFRRPAPALAAAVAAAQGGATALMDVSDGLVLDASRLATASNVAIDLLEPAASIPDDVERLAPVAARVGADGRDWVLGGGEDHGMLATFPPETTLPARFRPIGSVVEAPAGHEPRITIAGGPAGTATGWQHFAV